MVRTEPDTKDYTMFTHMLQQRGDPIRVPSGTEPSMRIVSHRVGDSALKGAAQGRGEWEGG